MWVIYRISFPCTSFVCLQGEGTLAESSLRRSSEVLLATTAIFSESLSVPRAESEMMTLSSPPLLPFSLARCSCLESNSRCFWKNSGSLKHFSRLAARWRVVGEFGVERENSSSSRSKFSALLLHIRGGSWSRNALRWPFDTSHIIRANQRMLFVGRKLRNAHSTSFYANISLPDVSERDS